MAYGQARCSIRLGRTHTMELEQGLTLWLQRADIAVRALPPEVNDRTTARPGGRGQSTPGNTPLSWTHMDEAIEAAGR